MRRSRRRVPLRQPAVREVAGPAPTDHARGDRGRIVNRREARVRRQPLRLRPCGWARDGGPAPRASGPNGRTRARIAEDLMTAHEHGRVRATIGRGSDFFGPFAHQSTVGDQVFARALAGKPARTLGDPDAPHTVTYIDDFAHALATLGAREEALGAVWHVPNAETVTMRRFVEMAFEAAGREPRLRTAPRWGLALVGLFLPDHPCGQRAALPVGAPVGGRQRQVRAGLRLERHTAARGDRSHRDVVPRANLNDLTPRSDSRRRFGSEGQLSGRASPAAPSAGCRRAGSSPPRRRRRSAARLRTRRPRPPAGAR